MSDQLIRLVKTFEGFHRVVKGAVPVMAGPYICPAGYLTIGYGHVCRPDQRPISEAEGEILLEIDLGIARAAVVRLITARLGAAQLDALTSWTFNLGAGRLRGSTLRAIINRGDLGLVPGELRKWVWGGGRKLPGLVLRREAEAAMFSGG